MIKNIFYTLRAERGAIILDEEDSRSVVYKGLKFMEEDGNYFVLSTERDIYTEVTGDVYDALNTKGLDYGVTYLMIARRKRAIKKFPKNTKRYNEINEQIKQLTNEIQSRI